MTGRRKTLVARPRKPTFKPMKQHSGPFFLKPWDLLPLAGALALGLRTWKAWPQLPDPLPTHFGTGGLPDGWTSKAAAPWFMFGIPLAWLVLTLLLGLAATPMLLTR